MLHTLLEAAGTSFIDGAYDKAIHRLSEPEFPLRLLPPYESTSEDAFRALSRRLAAEVSRVAAA